MKLPKPTHEIFCSTDSCNEHYGWEEADNLTAQQMKRVINPNDHRYIYTQDQVQQILDHVVFLIEKECDNWDDERPLRLVANTVRKLKEQL